MLSKEEMEQVLQAVQKENDCLKEIGEAQDARLEQIQERIRLAGKRMSDAIDRI